MKEFDAQLLRLIQDSVPLVSEPWEQIVGCLGCDAAAVLQRIDHLRVEGIIREISGIFDVVALGYSQTLVALFLPPEKLDSAGQIVALHPGVSHCYSRRDEQYNLWFTLAVSPESTPGLEEIARQLATQAGSGGCLLLPSLRRFKLAMRFDFDRPAAVASDDNSSPPQNPCEAAVECDETPATFNLTDRYRRAIAALQTDLPAKANPFAAIAAQAGLSADDLLVAAADMLSAGVMRRYGAVLHHRAAGARANAMVVWNVPPDKADLAGAAASRYSAVSHCYLRRTAADWLYNVYTMIHSHDRQHCQQTIDRIAADIGNPPHKTLWTEKEFKKARVKLFPPDTP